MGCGAASEEPLPAPRGLMPLPFPLLVPRGGVSGGATTQPMRVVPLGGAATAMCDVRDAGWCAMPPALVSFVTWTTGHTHYTQGLLAL
jgi:hypothetical protein